MVKEDLSQEDVRVIQEAFRMQPWISTVENLARKYSLSNQDIADVINYNDKIGVVFVDGGVFTSRHRRMLHYCRYKTNEYSISEIRRIFGLNKRETGCMLELSNEEELGKQKNDEINQKVIELQDKGLNAQEIAIELMASKKIIEDKMEYLKNQNKISKGGTEMEKENEEQCVSTDEPKDEIDCETKKKIIELYSQGLGYRKIASEIMKPEGTTDRIIKHLIENGDISEKHSFAKHISSDEQNAIFEFYKSGLTIPEISKKLCRSYDCIKRQIAKLNTLCEIGTVEEKTNETENYYNEKQKEVEIMEDKKHEGIYRIADVVENVINAIKEHKINEDFEITVTADKEVIDVKVVSENIKVSVTTKVV